MNCLGIQSFAEGACAAILCAASVLAACGSEAPRTAIIETAGSVTVTDVHGKPQRPLADAGQKATVLFFVLHDCPLANTCAPEINRIVTDYAPRGVRSFLVYVENDLSAKAARKHAKEHGFPCPALLDREGQLVRFTQVTTSPEVAVLAPDNTVRYRGRIDDRLVAFGKQRVAPTRRDLREALDSILEGKPVPNPVTKAVGCYLPAVEDAKSQNPRRSIPKLENPKSE